MWRGKGGCGVEELVGVERRLQWVSYVLNATKERYLWRPVNYRQHSVPVEMPLLLM